MRVGAYVGSFDPFTKGHESIVKAALTCVDRLIIGVGVKAGRAPRFSHAARKSFIQAVYQGQERVEVRLFDGLAVDFARDQGVKVLVRGLRNGADFDSEMQMAGMNAALAPGLETIFFAAPAHLRIVSATLVRQILEAQGDVTPFVPPAVMALMGKAHV